MLCASCLLRAALGPPSDPEPGDQVAGYEILEGPFAGGMGLVYRARKVGAPDALQVALKMMPVRREIEALAKLRHPGIVRIYDTGEHEGRSFFTMEFVDGGTLAERALDFAAPESAARLMRRIARAVDHGHNLLVLHLDLTPANILIDSEGRPHVADFGVSAMLGTSVRYGGTPEYMAPEQLPGDDRRLSFGCDIYALGAILYELLSRRPPFRANSRAELSAQIAEKHVAPLRSVMPGVDRDLAAICDKCLERDPDARYRTAAELAHDLDRWLRREPVSVRPGPSWRRTQFFARSHPFVSAGATWIFLALAAIGVSLGGALEQLRGQLVETRLNANEYTARHAAGNVLRVLREYAERLRDMASDVEFRRGVTDPEAEDRVLAPYRARGFDSIGFYTRAGVRTLRWPVIEATAYPRDFPWRDYFKGASEAGARACAHDVYVARSIRSESDRKHKLIVSAPVCEGDRFIGVVMATVDTAATLGSLRLDDARANGARGVLLGLRDRTRLEAQGPAPDAYRVLVHEGLADGDTAPVESAFGARLYEAWGPPLAAKLQLEPRREPKSLSERSYRDSVPGFAGRWLAGAAPVGGTGLVVVVQTRYDDVVAPGEALTARVLWLMLGLASALAGLVAAQAYTQRRPRGRSAGGSVTSTRWTPRAR